MRVFLSWSGERSKLVAELLNTWLKCTIQSLQPWISTRGIGRGELWFPAINRELAQTSVGIVCLTRDNINAPWILFEAGALAKGLDSNRVITFLIDLDPSDVNDPLAQFNHTLPVKDSLYELLNTVNTLSSNPLEIKIIERVFEKYWDEFEKEFKSIIDKTPVGAKPKKISGDEMLNQILDTVKGLDRRVRSVENKNLDSESDLRNRLIKAEQTFLALREENSKLRMKNQSLINATQLINFNTRNSENDDDGL